MYVSKNRVERINAITDFVARSTYDIIALQEIWVYADYNKVRSAVQHRLPHAKFFYRYITVFSLRLAFTVTTHLRFLTSC